MSVLIRGMEMPENGTYICILEADMIWFINKDNATKFRVGEICKVPTPHGRLIDADELLEHKTDHDMISTHLIYNAPTVIESEE